MSFFIGFALGSTVMYLVFSYYIRKMSKGFFDKFVDDIFEDDNY